MAQVFWFALPTGWRPRLDLGHTRGVLSHVDGTTLELVWPWEGHMWNYPPRLGGGYLLSAPAGVRHPDGSWIVTVHEAQISVFAHFALATEDDYTGPGDWLFYVVPTFLRSNGEDAGVEELALLGPALSLEAATARVEQLRMQRRAPARTPPPSA